ncbi:MAG: hypothetical protein DCF20_04910 [Pseudanabaena sp.]|nr:MAG: hypothetical protein DCF20_04910 [Pseudanabaena sp.]
MDIKSSLSLLSLSLRLVPYQDVFVQSAQTNINIIQYKYDIAIAKKEMRELYDVQLSHFFFGFDKKIKR